MKRVGEWIVVCVVLAMMLGCVRQGPQRPSQRKGETPPVDSAALALLELNKQLAQAADQQLVQWVQASGEPYALYEANTWMWIIERGDTHAAAPKQGESWTVHMRTYDLNGQLFCDSEGTYVIGKQELPAAVDSNIGELYPGGKARLLAPWYQAYGLTGTDHIPPYENIMIEIELK